MTIAELIPLVIQASILLLVFGLGLHATPEDTTYLLVPAQTIVGQFLATFKEFPPRQKAASFSLDQVMDKLLEATKS